MTSNVLAAAILQGKVLVFFIRSNNNGMNLVWIVSGLMQLARHENFSKQSAWSLQFLVVATLASQCNNAAERSALNWPPCPNLRTPYLARASMTWTILVIMASNTSTLSSEDNWLINYVIRSFFLYTITNKKFKMCTNFCAPF